MKKLLPCLLTLCTLTAGLWSCGGSEPDKETNLTTTDKPGGALPAFQVPADSAQNWMIRWGQERHDIIQALNNTPSASDSTFLVYGFHVPRLELDSMLNYLGPNPNVWAMLAIKYDSKNKAYVPELVFAAEPNTVAPTWSYYDFTAPCPTSCPQDNVKR